MSVVGQILDKTQFVEEIDGLPFTLRIITAETAAQVIGNKVLGMMRSGTVSKELPKDEVIRVTKGYLGACMVSPKFGEQSDPDADTISLEDLGLFSDKILTAVFEKSGFEMLGKSNGSSKGTEGES